MSTRKKERQKWAEEHALRMARRFEQWQKPLGIDTEEYLRYLKEELVDCSEDPLRKSLVESIS
ncbi:MAG: hypothetical protein ACYSTF_05295 [Planctomycetota bacterium]|jgi:hypothetical protein